MGYVSLLDPSGSNRRRPDAGHCLSMLLYWATDARQYGVSWRDFRVGVSALARRWNAVQLRFEYAIFCDANNKPLEEGGHRKCGEEYIIDRLKDSAKNAGFDCILWIVIVSETQVDDKAPKALIEDPGHQLNKTLKSCGYCRTMFNDLLSVYRKLTKSRLITRNTLITSFNVQTLDMDTYKMGWLLRHYGVPNMRWPYKL